MSRGMLKLFKYNIILLFLAVNLFATTKSFDFDLIKKGKDDDNTLLIVGGIQGDEPGGFMAASLIATHYKITKGSVWVVPNLNFYSIIKRSRGPFGDMNRKFAKISKDDPDYDSVQRIKKYIKSENVKLIVNLHDGSGFYRHKYIDRLHSQYRWGQSTIIDQEKLNIQKYSNLGEISEQVCDHINKYLIDIEHSYRVKNTKTRLGDKEMEKTLTYYAINNGKAAFGHETSKSLPLHERVYYQLLGLEKYMDIMGIEYTRNFTLSPKIVKNVVDNDIYISFYDEKINLPLGKVKNILKYFPIKKDGSIDFVPSNPLMTIIKNGKNYTIHYGNRRLAHLSPDYLDIINEERKVKIKVDGKETKVKYGSIVKAYEDFYVYPQNGIRVNVIGYRHKRKRNESGLKIKKHQISKRFSIDKKGNIYRVEFYKDKSFAGMVLVKFDKKTKSGIKELSVAANEASAKPSS